MESDSQIRKRGWEDAGWNGQTRFCGGGQKMWGEETPLLFALSRAINLILYLMLYSTKGGR